MQPVSQITLPAELASLDRLYTFIEEAAQAMALSADKAYDLQLVSSELVTNIIEHGYQGQSGVIDVRLAHDEAEVLVEYVDDAPAFDPRTAPEPDLTLSLEERPIGGLGIYLVGQLMKEFDYTRLPEGRNQVRLMMSKASA